MHFVPTVLTSHLYLYMRFLHLRRREHHGEQIGFDQFKSSDSPLDDHAPGKTVQASLPPRGDWFRATIWKLNTPYLPPALSG